jgi:hypothetical protein
MVVEFAKGQVQKFVATRDFALNFENRNIPSVKIREGETIEYDGSVAVYLRSDGDIAKGRCPGLKSAINVMGWLVPVVEEARPEDPETQLEEGNLFEEELAPPNEVVIPSQEGEEYDGMKGGSFDVYAQKDADVHVVGTKGTEVIKEEDLIVKEIPAIKSPDAKKKGGKLEVAGDQVEVKLVTSSTVTPGKGPKRGFEVVQSNQYGADSSTPMKTKKATAEPQQKKTYVVDDSTPRATEGMSIEAVHRITKVINADESQDAKVVKTFDRKMEVKEVEGITLRKTESPKEMTFKKTKSPEGLTITTKVSSGSTAVADVSQQDAVVVGTVGGVKAKTPAVEPQEAVEVSRIGEEKSPIPKVGPDEKTGTELIADIFGDEKSPEEIKKEEEKKATSDKRAKERAAGRKKSSAQTQKKMEKASTPAQEIPEPEPKVEVKEASTDYLSMLPDDWGKLHWVKKEQFIKKQTDVAFIQFIKSVETTKAIQNACTERLIELEQTG